MTVKNIAFSLLQLIPQIYMVVSGHEGDLIKLAESFEAVAATLRTEADPQPLSMPEK